MFAFKGGRRQLAALRGGYASYDTCMTLLRQATLSVVALPILIPTHPESSVAISVGRTPNKEQEHARQLARVDFGPRTLCRPEAVSGNPIPLKSRR